MWAQFGKHSALHHVETNAIGELNIKYPACLSNTSIKRIKIVITHLAVLCFLRSGKSIGLYKSRHIALKMEKYGARGLPLKLFRSYFQNRQQFISGNNVSSHMNNNICGVPQGSTLGPLLFNVYINDLRTSKVQVRLFADDTNLTASHNNRDTRAKLVNKELVRISNWMKINLLTINYT